MPNESSTRSIHYRRAVWVPEDGQTFQGYLEAIHGELGTTVERDFNYNNLKVACVAYRKDTETSAVLMHLVQYLPGEMSSIISAPSIEELLETEEYAAPPGKDYVRGDLFLLCSVNHVLLCTTNRVRAAVLSGYLEQAAQRSGIESISGKCSLKSIADVQKLRLVRQEGVSQIVLSSSLYEATAMHEEAGESTGVGLLRRTLGSVAGVLEDLFADDPSLQEIHEMEKISVQLVVKYNRQNKKGDEARIGKERIEKIGRTLIDDDEEGFKVITGEGKEIGHTDLKVQKRVPMTRRGASVTRQSAWGKMLDFFKDLKDQGVLEE